MKKILIATVVLGLAFAAAAFAADTTTTNPTVKPTVTAAATPTKAETKPTATVNETTLNGSIISMDATTLKVKDNANKEWAFKVGTVDCKNYKVGDKVTVNYEKDNLKSIAKAK